MRILITGIAGTIGTILAERLSAEHDVTGIDLRSSDAFPTGLVDLNDYEALLPEMDGVEAVIHLAAERQHERHIGWDVLMPRNVQPTANVFQAAHEAGVRRVVFASSMHVMGMYEGGGEGEERGEGREEGLSADTVPLVGRFAPVSADGR